MEARETETVPGGGTIGGSPPLHGSCWDSVGCVQIGVKGLYICTNSPWISEGLMPRTWPGHRVTLRCCQFEGWGPPLFVMCRGKGEPLASTPIGHHVSCPYVKGGAIWGASGAVAGHPTRLAAGLAGKRCQAASAVQDLGAAGIAGGGSGMDGKVVFLLFLLLLLGILIVCTLLAAVILGRRKRGCLRGSPAPPPPITGTTLPHLLRNTSHQPLC